MIIRPFRIEDFEAVCRLLEERNVEAPRDITEVGMCLVAEDNGEIVGCISAQYGKSTKAYCDFYAAKKTMIAWNLLQHLMTVLRIEGIRKIDFHIEEYNEEFLKMSKKYGCKELNPLKWMRCEL